LGAGEVASGELGLKALAHASLDDVELLLGLLGQGAEVGGLFFDDAAFARVREFDFGF
jgi:hypothetical protein